MIDTNAITNYDRYMDRLKSEAADIIEDDKRDYYPLMQRRPDLYDDNGFYIGPKS